MSSWAAASRFSPAAAAATDAACGNACTAGLPACALPPLVKMTMRVRVLAALVVVVVVPVLGLPPPPLLLLVLPPLLLGQVVPMPRLQHLLETW
jgi:hypothetical protein